MARQLVVVPWQWWLLLCWSSDCCEQCPLSHTQRQKDEVFLLFTLLSHIPLTITASLCRVHTNLGLCLPAPIFRCSAAVLCVCSTTPPTPGMELPMGRWWHEPWADGHLHTGHSDTVNSRLEQLTLCKGARPRLELSLCAVHRSRGLTAGSLSALWGMVTETPWCRWLTERDWYSSASPGLPGKQHRCACAAPEGCFLTRSSTFPC